MANSESAKKKRKKQYESPLTASAAASSESPKDQETKRQNDKSSHNKKKQPKKSKQALKEEEEERRLTAMIFGGASDGDFHHDHDEDQPELLTLENSKQISSNEEEDPGLMFEIDRTGVDDEDDDDEDEETAENKVQKLNQIMPKNDGDNSDSDDEDDSNNNNNNKPAWVDDDDEDVQVDLLQTDRLRKLRKSRDEDTTARPITGKDFEERLRDRYKNTMQLTAQTEWARMEDDDAEASGSDDEDEDGNPLSKDDAQVAALQASSQPLLMHGAASSTTGRLPPNLLNVMRCPDANQADYNNAVVQAIHFHPGSDPNRPLLLTAGLDKTLRFFHVGVESSDKIHGIHCTYRVHHNTVLFG